MPPVTACVRLNPSHSGEVVWGERIDPARLVVLNVPLPESEHRLQDIVLNDGAESGTRELNNTKAPVFHELAIWQRSKYSMFRVNIRTEDASAQDILMEFCRSRKLGLDDWSSIRILCAECSRGNPGSHDCGAIQEEGRRRFGLAAQTRKDAIAVLRDWKESGDDAEFSDLEVVLNATVH